METAPTVFVVDEDPLARSTVRQSAIALNLACEEYATGLEFVERLNPTRPGCVVLENRIPGLSGLEIQQRLTAQIPTLPVIFAARQLTVSVAVRAMRAGAVHVLEKPLREAELWETLQEAIQLNQLRRTAEHEQQRSHDRIAQLTAKEMQVMKAVSAGASNAEMAARFRVSQRTIELRRSKVMKKLKVGSLAELVRLVMVAESGDGESVRPTQLVKPSASGSGWFGRETIAGLGVHSAGRDLSGRTAGGEVVAP